MNKFGEEIKVEQASFIVNGSLYTGFYPKMEVNGEYVYIRDEEYPTDMMNADTRYKAKKLGEEYLERIVEFINELYKGI